MSNIENFIPGDKLSASAKFARNADASTGFTSNYKEIKNGNTTIINNNYIVDNAINSSVLGQSTQQNTPSRVVPNNQSFNNYKKDIQLEGLLESKYRPRIATRDVYSYKPGSINQRTFEINQLYGYERTDINAIRRGEMSGYAKKVSEAMRPLQSAVRRAEEINQQIAPLAGYAKLLNKALPTIGESLTRPFMTSLGAISTSIQATHTVLSIPQQLQKIVDDYSKMYSLARSQRITGATTIEQRGIQTVGHTLKGFTNLGSIGSQLLGISALSRIATGNFLEGFGNSVVGSIGKNAMIAGAPLRAMNPMTQLVNQLTWGQSGIGSPINIDNPHGIAGLIKGTSGDLIAAGVSKGGITGGLMSGVGGLGGVFGPAFLTPMVVGLITAKIAPLFQKYLSPPRNTSLLAKASSISNKLLSVKDIEKASKTADEMPGMMAILRSDPNISVADSIMITILSAIETNTSGISGYIARQLNDPTIKDYNRIKQHNQLVDNLNETGTGNLRTGADQRGWLQKLSFKFQRLTEEMKMMMPATYLSALIQGKSLTKIYKDMVDQNIVYDLSMEKSQELGVNMDSIKLLYTPATKVMSMGTDPMVALTAGIYGLNQMAARELLTIRKTLGANEDITLHDQFRGNRGGVVDMISNALGYIPGVFQLQRTSSWLYNMITGGQEQKEWENREYGDTKDKDLNLKGNWLTRRFTKMFLNNADFFSDKFKYFDDENTLRAELKKMGGTGVIDPNEINKKIQSKVIPSLLEEQIRYLHDIEYNTRGTLTSIFQLVKRAGIDLTLPTKTAKERRFINKFTGELTTQREYDNYRAGLVSKLTEFIGKKEEIGNFESLFFQYPKNLLNKTLNKLSGGRLDKKILDQAILHTKGGQALFGDLNSHELNKIYSKTSRADMKWSTPNYNPKSIYSPLRGYHDDTPKKKYKKTIMNMSPKEYMQLLIKSRKEKGMTPMLFLGTVLTTFLTGTVIKHWDSIKQSLDTGWGYIKKIYSFFQKIFSYITPIFEWVAKKLGWTKKTTQEELIAHQSQIFENPKDNLKYMSRENLLKMSQSRDLDPKYRRLIIEEFKRRAREGTDTKVVAYDKSIEHKRQLQSMSESKDKIAIELQKVDYKKEIQEIVAPLAKQISDVAQVVDHSANKMLQTANEFDMKNLQSKAFNISDHFIDNGMKLTNKYTQSALNYIGQKGY